jgi:hypothetical protein
MSANANSTMYDAIPAVSELNKVPGFNPLKFLRKTADGPKLDLKYKKLWFRLKHPSGRTKLTALRITDQLAIIEAKVYFDKNDANPNGSFIATRYAQSTPGGLYIEAAQHDAMDAALSDAGFGVQFLPAEPANAAEAVRSTVPVKEAAIVETHDERMNPVPSVEKKTPTVTERAPAAAEASLTPAVAEAPASHAAEAAPAAIVEAPAFQAEESAPVTQDTIPAPAPAQAEAMTAEAVPAVTLESLSSPAEPSGNPSGNPSEVPAAYTPDMPVDEICAVMTMEEAGDVIVPVGTCKDWTLSQVADRRPASLKWYLNGYNGNDNILRAGAKLMLEAISSMEKAG